MNEIVTAFGGTLDLVVYASDRARDEGHLDLWVRHVNQPEAVRLTRHPADDWMPRFSPDGSRVVFHSWRDGGGIYLVNALGGSATPISWGELYTSLQQGVVDGAENNQHLAKKTRILTTSPGRSCRISLNRPR